MIVGYNVHIRHDGNDYHVQTEDKGVKDAVIETLVYVGGKILHAERTSYRDIAGKCEEKEIAALMDMQHKRVIQSIRSGRFDEGPRKSFGADLSTSRSFDQIVMEFLEEGAEDSLELVLKGDAPLRAGQPARIRVLTRKSVTKGPIPNAQLTVHIEAKDQKSAPIARGTTGPDGVAEIVLNLPKSLVEGSTVVISATSDLGEDRIRQRITVAGETA
jgi:hypothetical protein